MGSPALEVCTCVCVCADSELLAITNVLHYYQKRLHVYVYQVSAWASACTSNRAGSVQLPVSLPVHAANRLCNHHRGMHRQRHVWQCVACCLRADIRFCARWRHGAAVFLLPAAAQ